MRPLLTASAVALAGLVGVPCLAGEHFPPGPRRQVEQVGELGNPRAARNVGVTASPGLRFRLCSAGRWAPVIVGVRKNWCSFVLNLRAGSIVYYS